MTTLGCSLFLLSFAALPSPVFAGTITITFEGLADGAALTNQYPGLMFTNAVILTAGVGLNEFEFPPHSGTNVASDNGGPLSIAFSSPIQSFSGYFTYAEPLTLQAFDIGNTLLTSITSAFHNNEALSGAPGSSPNELLQLTSESGISSITITGSSAGGSFTLDDANFAAQVNTVPEPGSFLLLLTALPALLFMVGLRRITRMRRSPGVLVGTVVLLSLASRAHAAQSIGIPTPSPDAVYINEPAVVTVVAAVAPDPALIPNSVTLIRVTNSGQTVANLGQMYDDGTHGDAIAGDGNFTTVVTFNETAVTTISLTVTAAYRGQLLRVRSVVAYLPAVVHPTATEVLQVSTVQSTGAAFFANRRTVVGDNQAILDLVTFLRNQSGVQDAAVSQDNSMVGITFTNGLHSGIYTTPVGSKGSGATLKAAALMSAVPPAATGSIDYPGIDKALVLAPFFSQSGTISPDEGFPVALSLSNTCAGPISPITDSGVTLDVMKTLPQYGTIYITSHGGLFPDPNGGQDYVMVSTGQKFDPNATLSPTDAQDWAAGRIVPGTPVNQPVSYWGITPRFIAKYGQGLKKTIVDISTCDSAANTTMAAQFLANGAGAHLGFNAEVLPNSSLAIETSFIDTLTNVALPAGARTIGTAFANSNPGSIFTLYPAPNNIAMCGPPAIRLNPFGNQTLASTPGPYSIEAIKVSGTQVTVAPAPDDISVTTQRVVNSQCRGVIVSSNSSATISKNQTSTGLPGFVAGRDPFCNTLPITTTWTILGASLGGSALDLSNVPAQQLTLSVTR